ncbi:response regulator [Deltaproteobacteria bacterium TL4]
MMNTQILVVEDEGLTGLALQDQLVGLGYRIPVIVKSGKKAIQVAHAIKPDLILMDIFLEGTMDGIEAARQIKSTHDIPIVYLTAYGDEETIERAKPTQPCGYLVKPVQKQTLNATIECALYNYRTNGQLQQQFKELLQTEQALRKKANYLSLALDIGQVGIWSWINGEITWVGALLENSEALVSPMKYEEFLKHVHPEDRNLAHSHIEAAIQSGCYDPVDFRFINQAGDLKWTHTRAQVIQDENESDRGLLGVTIDITQRKEFETQRLQAQKMEALVTLAGGLAHDFNNLLGPILGFVELVSLGLDPKSDEATNLRMVTESANIAAELIGRLLIFAFNADFKTQTVHLNKIVEEVLLFLYPLIPRNIILHEELALDLPPIVAESSQIRQVLVNLCLNAIQAMPEGGTLTIGLTRVSSYAFINDHGEKRAGEFVCLSVEDTGIGMDQRTLERIFDPYFSTKPRGAQKGTGLGLAVVSGIVKQHGGHIVVKSEVGKLTTFQIYLPLRAEAKKTTLFQVPHEGKETHILFVDDNPIVTEIGTLLLERLGYQVTSFTDSREALQAFESDPKRFQLVITSYDVSLMSGEQLVEKLRLIRQDIPILLNTGDTNLMTENILQKLGFDGVVTKPYRLQVLSQEIKKMLH